MRLPQRERLEHLVERAETTRKEHDGGSPQNEVKLAQGEILELKTEFRCDERIGLLLAGEFDVEADRFAADVERTPIGRFHDPWAAASDDHIVTLVVALVVDRYESGKLAGRIVVAAVGEELFCPLEFAGEPLHGLRRRRDGG